MKITFIASSKDLAGVNIADKVSRRFELEETEDRFYDMPVLENGNIRLLYINVESIDLDQVALPYKSDLIVMLSKHKSAQGTKSLTAHPTGNLLNEAKLGGKPQKVAYTNPWYMSEYYRRLAELDVTSKIDNLVKSLEVTHHGPTENQTPLFFVEIGSDEEQWRNPSLGELTAEALYETIKEEPKKVNAFVGFGGGHYAPAFSYYLEKENIALGHMVSKYALAGGIDGALILSLFRKSLLDKPRALIDRKGLPSKTYRELIDFFSDNSIEVLKI